MMSIYRNWKRFKKDKCTYIVRGADISLSLCEIFASYLALTLWLGFLNRFCNRSSLSSLFESSGILPLISQTKAITDSFWDVLAFKWLCLTYNDLIPLGVPPIGIDSSIVYYCLWLASIVFIIFLFPTLKLLFKMFKLWVVDMPN